MPKKPPRGQRRRQPKIAKIGASGEVEKPKAPGQLLITQDHRNQVETMAGFGMKISEIATLLHIDEDSVRKNFAKELRSGAPKADSAVLNNLYKLATGDGPNAAKCAVFWVKVRRRWHEVSRVIHGFDPMALKQFVREVIAVIKRSLPEKCPHCKTNLELRPKIAADLLALSAKMEAKAQPPEFIPIEAAGAPSEPETSDA